MAPITLEKVTKVYPNGFEASTSSTWTSPTASSWFSSALRVRQDDGAADGRGPRGHHERHFAIGDRVVNDVSPKDRDIAMVFQNYALYPHMTVGENIGFALKLRKRPKAEIKKKVDETAAMLGLTEWIDRKPAQLSGGQRQRVAMGRAIVREPSVFLMDEPLSNLDAKLRVQMRAEVARIQRRIGVATLYVTHDQVEAMTMGDRVACPERRRAPAVRRPAGALRPPEEPLRRRLHGLAGHEPVRGRDRRRGGSVLIGSQKIELPADRLTAQARASRPTPTGLWWSGSAPRTSRSSAPTTSPRGSGSATSRVRRARGGARLGAARPLHGDAHRVEAEGTKDDDAEGLNEGTLAKSAKAWPASSRGRSSQPGAG